LLRLYMDVARPPEIGVLDDAVAELDDRARLLVDVGVRDGLCVRRRAILDADLLDDVVKSTGLVAPLAELVLDFLLPGEHPDDVHAGHLLDLCRKGDLERVCEGHQEEVSHLADWNDEVLLAEIQGDPFKRRVRDLVVGDVEGGQAERPSLRDEALEGGYLVVLLQQPVERVAVQVLRADYKITP